MSIVKAEGRENDIILAIRIRELCQPPTTWNRSLWTVSSLTILQEILEAASVRRDGILSDSSLQNLQSTASAIIARDPGLGDVTAKRSLLQSVHPKQIITPQSLASAHIELAIKEAHTQYLPRWGRAIESGVTDRQIELCARAVASHLLNRGHHRAAVAEKVRLAIFTKGLTASEMIIDLNDMCCQKPVSYTAVFPVLSAPSTGKTNSIGWLNKGALSKWVRTQKVVRPNGGEGDRFVGAVRIEVRALDLATASEKSYAQFRVLNDRAILGAGAPIVSTGYHWIEGDIRPRKNELHRRGVEVASIDRQDQIYDADSDDQAISRAISLLAELDHGPSSSAVTSGWAALESLAIGPAEAENRAETATRAAALITASYPRAELTKLAYAYTTSHSDNLSTALKNAPNNKTRAELMLSSLQTQPLPNFKRVEDVTAAKRLHYLIADPVGFLNRINGYIETALKRLYRVRNMVAHGGRTDSIVLESTIGTAAPLVGAAFDRIHHANISSKVRPLELVARAQHRLGLLSETSPNSVISLLE